MSGGLSVPLAIAAFFVPNDKARGVPAVTATACFIAAAYQIWSAERPKVVGLEEKIEAAKDVHAEA
jgi:hypothetical protein